MKRYINGTVRVIRLRAMFELSCRRPLSTAALLSAWHSYVIWALLASLITSSTNPTSRHLHYVFGGGVLYHVYHFKGTASTRMVDIIESIFVQ